MKAPLSWLKDHVDIDLPPLELARRLTFAGLEVESMTFVGLPAPAQSRETKVEGFPWDRDKLVVGALVEVKPHPGADRLALATVEDGRGIVTIVTGAPNVVELSGKGPLASPLKVALAKEGAVLRDAHKPGAPLTRLGKTTIRGVESSSMMCSEKELGISDEHTGVIVLDDDALPGVPLVDYMGDVVLEIAITPNHARNASILGVAREIAALTGARLKNPDYSILAEGPPITGQVGIEIRRPELNPRFVLALIKDLEIKPSPYALQRRLRLAGMRPISNIVDVTNYVMLELGQPLHAFDYEVLQKRAGDGVPTILTRLPDPGERLTTLDDVDRRLDDFTILVCDTAGAISLGGIMGGAETEVGPDTRHVLLEGASWEFINIRRTMQAQKIESEAGYRFSRGVAPAMADRGVRRAIEMMRRLSGGVVAEGVVDEFPGRPEPVVVELPVSEVERLLGIRLETEEIVGILRSLEFHVEVDGDRLQVKVPDHRLDIGTGSTGRADLIEEIARIHGYDRIPETQISDTIPPQRENVEAAREERVRDILVECGLQEVVNYRLTTPERERRAMFADTGAPELSYVRLENPISADRDVLRRSLLPAVLEVLERNSRFRESLGLFEIGPVFQPGSEELPEETRRLALAMVGPRNQHHWQESDRGERDFFDLKGVVEELLRGLHLTGAGFEPGEHASLHPGKCARLTLAGAEIGFLGELHPVVARRLGLDGIHPVGAELDLDLLLREAPDRFEIAPVFTNPPLLEDLAVIVDQSVAAAQVREAILRAGTPLVTEVRLFDVYRGEQIEAGKKSLAYAVTYQSDRNLNETEVGRVRERIIATLGEKLGASLRG